MRSSSGRPATPQPAGAGFDAESWVMGLIAPLTATRAGLGDGSRPEGLDITLSALVTSIESTETATRRGIHALASPRTVEYAVPTLSTTNTEIAAIGDVVNVLAGLVDSAFAARAVAAGKLDTIIADYRAAAVPIAAAATTQTDLDAVVKLATTALSDGQAVANEVVTQIGEHTTTAYNANPNNTGEGGVTVPPNIAATGANPNAIGVSNGNSTGLGSGANNTLGTGDGSGAKPNDVGNGTDITATAPASVQPTATVPATLTGTTTTITDPVLAAQVEVQKAALSAGVTIAKDAMTAGTTIANSLISNISGVITHSIDKGGELAEKGIDKLAEAGESALDKAIPDPDSDTSPAGAAGETGANPDTSSLAGGGPAADANAPASNARPNGDGTGQPLASAPAEPGPSAPVTPSPGTSIPPTSPDTPPPSDAGAPGNSAPGDAGGANGSGVGAAPVTPAKPGPVETERPRRGGHGGITAPSSS